MYSCSVPQAGSDAKARKPVSDGRLGYQGVCNTLEGMCELLVEWNRRASQILGKQVCTVNETTRLSHGSKISATDQVEQYEKQRDAAVKKAIRMPE